MLNDLRLGIRTFRRHIGLSIAAVLSLALGIGANTAIFSVLQTVVLRPMPYNDPERLVIVWETSAENSKRWVAPANFVDWRRDARSFASIAAFDEFAPTLTGFGEAERLRALGASGTFFTTLGARPLIGRTLLPADDEPGATDVAMLSEGLWRRLFGGAADALTRTLLLDGRQYAVVGVMPADFESPLQSAPIDLWLSGDRGVPRTFPFGGDLTTVRDSHIIYVIGRLADGATRDVAQQELTQLMAQLAQRYPSTNAGLGVNLEPLHEAIVGDVRPLLILLQLAVGLTLLIACANVAHLLLGQAAERQGEMAMRVALGAGRRRLLRQLMAETLTIAIPGGVLGIALATVGLTGLIALAPSTLPRAEQIAIDGAALAFTVALTLVTAIIFGLGPALQTSTLAAASQSHLRVAGARRVKRWHHAIVVTELALAEVLLVGAALLLASFAAAERVPLGFETSGRIAADLSLAPERYLQPTAAGNFRIDPTRKIQFVTTVLERIQATPGVRTAAASFTSPLTGAPNRGISIPGRPERGPGLEDNADFQLVTPDFFRAVGATLIRGRAFTSADHAGSAPVAIVNQAFADRYFANENPIGKQMQFGGDRRPEIVGVVGDMRYRSVENAADPTFYIPITQNDERWPYLSFSVWADGDAAALALILRDAIRRADPNQAVTRVRTYDTIVASALAPRRFNTTLLTVFAFIALALAAVGTYGVMAYAVSRRGRELGVRAALGATPADLLRLVMRNGAWLTVIAVAVGLVASVAVTGAMRSLLFDVTPRDPATMAVVAAGLTVVALLATFVPAQRAVRVNPTRALQDG